LGSKVVQSRGVHGRVPLICPIHPVML
jgi:hypothetical protein